MGIARNIARLIPNGSGLLPNANIEAVAASKLTGSVPIANGGSRVIKTHTYVNSTRQVTSSSSNYNYFTWTLDKVSSTSTLYFHVVMCAFGNTNSGIYIGIGIDGSYDFTGYGGTDAAGEGFITIAQPRTGIGSGNRTITLNQIPIDGSANRTFDVVNPNSSDDARNRQQATQFIVYEVENA